MNWPASVNLRGFIVGGLACLLFAFPTHAAFFVVNTVSDLPDTVPGDGACQTTELLPSSAPACSLRAALEEAAALAGADRVDLPAGTYGLSSGDGPLEIDDSLELRGAGMDETTIDGLHQTRIFQVRSGNGREVLIQDLSIQRGASGAALYCSGQILFEPFSAGALTLRRLKVVDSIGTAAIWINAADGECGDVVIEDALIARNEGGIVAYPGPIFGNAPTASLVIRRTRIEDNTGATIGMSGDGLTSGILRVEDSVIKGNGTCDSGQPQGSTIGLGEDISAILDRVTIEENCGGGISMSEDSSLLLTRSEISRNQGTGINIGGFFVSSVEVRDSTISGNISESPGGGVYSFGLGIRSTPVFKNVTISGNHAPMGGGVFNIGASDIIFENSTIVRNTALEGGGLYGSDGTPFCGGPCGGYTGHAVLQNTVIADNAATDGADCFVDDAGLTPEIGDSALIGIIDACGLTGTEPDLLSGTLAEPLSAELGPLALAGGPMRTHVPTPDSVLIDAVESSASCPSADQRNVPRPLDGDQSGAAQCDLGSVEVRLTEFVPAEILLDSAGSSSDRFGGAVALASAGQTALIGAFRDDTPGGSNAGSAHIQARTANNTWVEEDVLLAPDGAAGDQFGFSLALSSAGDVAIVGANEDATAAGIGAGSVHLFDRGVNGTWAHIAQLLAPDAAADDHFGHSVDLSGDGDIAVIGALTDGTSAGTGTGSVSIFTRSSGGAWGFAQQLLAPDAAPFDNFGGAVSISLDGNTLAVGTLGDNTAAGFNAGSVYLFERGAGGDWVFETQLLAPDGLANDIFGSALAVSPSGDAVVVSAPDDDTPAGPEAGSAHVFRRSSDGSWHHEAQLFAPDAAMDDNFGEAVAITSSGQSVLIGARHDDTLGGIDAGSSYLFVRVSPDRWTLQQRFVAPDGGALGDQFGRAVAVSTAGDAALVGSAVDSTSIALFSGSANAFTLPGEPNPDADGDGIQNAFDNCPVSSNPGQADGDLDGIGDNCDLLITDPCETPGENLASTASLEAFQNNSCEDWSGQISPNADLQSAVLSKADLTSAELTGTLLMSATLREANLSGAILAGAHLQFASLELADLAGANLSQAVLSGGRLVEAKMTGVNLAGADLTGADMRGADLTTTAYDENTIFPSGGNYLASPWGLAYGRSPWEVGMVPVPEPASDRVLVLAVLGFCGLALRSRRRRPLCT